MQYNLDGLNVCGHDDELADTAIQRLGGFVGSLFELLVVGSLLDQVEDLGGERGIRQREGLGVCCAGHGCEEVGSGCGVGWRELWEDLTTRDHGCVCG